MTKITIDVGSVYWRLTVVGEAPKKGASTARRVFVQCSCGSPLFDTNIYSLAKGKTKSCGCLQKELAKKMRTKHGLEGSPTYKTWNNMMMRCYNPKRINYAEYGGAGVTVCEKWRTFAGFFEDMGIRPEGTSLNRMGGAKVYSKENCEWATSGYQSFDQKKRSTNTSGRTGISFQKATGKWKVGISKNRVSHFIGYFTDLAEAIAAREAAELKYYGKVLNNG